MKDSNMNKAEISSAIPTAEQTASQWTGWRANISPANKLWLGERWKQKWFAVHVKTALTIECRAMLSSRTCLAKAASLMVVQRSIRSSSTTSGRYD
jgi:hypothetical protein